MCVADPSGELHWLWSPSLLLGNNNKDKSSSPEVEHHLLKDSSQQKQHNKYSKKSNEWVPHKIQMFPLNIILHGWLLPADPTCDGLHVDLHWSPNGQDLAALCSSECIYN